MLKRLDIYILRQIATVTTLIAVVLTGVMLMTQSLRFLDLVIASGASGLAFITLSLLALPRFFEVILPIALSAATIFIYTRLRQDGELTVMRAVGMTPMRLARPGIVMGLLLSVVLFVILGWVAPTMLARMTELRQTIRVQYSAALFREGVFNSIGDDVTIYVAKRLPAGGLEGLMIHDARPQNVTPVTVTASSGQLVMTDNGQQVLVFNGVRQALNPRTGNLERLQFERYIIDLPDAGPVQKRWAEPEERTLDVLLWPPKVADPTADQLHQEFVAETHRRFLSPLLAPSFAIVTICLLLLSPYARTRTAWEIAWVAGVLMLLQSLYIGAFSVAKKEMLGVVLMYVLVFGPSLLAYIALVRASRTPIRAVGDHQFAVGAV